MQWFQTGSHGDRPFSEIRCWSN